MRILGIDPSLSSTGWAVIEDGKVVRCGTIKSTPKDGSLIERIDQIWLSMTHILTELYHNDTFNAIAIEDVFINRRNLQVPIQLAKVHGAILASLFFRLNGEAWRIKIYAPRFVKQAITGNGNATKEQVLKMVQMISGYNGKSDDEADAAAIALTCERELQNL